MNEEERKAGRWNIYTDDFTAGGMPQYGYPILQENGQLIYQEDGTAIMMEG